MSFLLTAVPQLHDFETPASERFFLQEKNASQNARNGT
jgi:hypothetical protein